MSRKPIGPTAHWAIDDDSAALIARRRPSSAGGPGEGDLLRFAASQGRLDAHTDHPLGLEGLPLRVHAELKTPYVPAIPLLPWVMEPSS